MSIHFNDAAGPPGMRIYAIGDVHGRLDLLTAMHDRIASELSRHQPADWRIVHLGDYVDRGPESRGVVDLLSRRRAEDARVICLMGNHEEGMLSFLRKPKADGLFVRYGGVETASSYGVSLDVHTPDLLARSHAELEEAMPPSHREFLAALPRSVTFGDFFFCHAGIRPGVPLDQQKPEDLVWIREPFLNHPGLHEKVVVHGHTPTDQPEIMPARVNIDTGAYATGRLTALAIDGKEKRILSVEGPVQSAWTP